MPQGREKSLGEKAAFAFMLRNINYIYLGMPVLILLDVSYPGRCTDCFACRTPFVLLHMPSFKRPTRSITH